MNDRNDGRESEQADGHRPPDRPKDGHANSAAPAEWIVGVISALLVLGALAFIAVNAVSGRNGPPMLSIQTDSVVAMPGAHMLMFTVRNEGSETAATVQVSGELTRGGETVEASQATLDFVPEGASRRGSLQFKEDPRSHTLELRVSGFAFP